MQWLEERPYLWRNKKVFGPRSDAKRELFELMQRNGLYSPTTVWSDTGINHYVEYLRAKDRRKRERTVKERFGVISIATWNSWTPRQKSKIIDLQWQIPRAVESLGQAWKVAQLLLNWGCTIEWVPALDNTGSFYCDIRTETAKISLKTGIGYGPTLSEALCCAALRCVELLALK